MSNAMKSRDLVHILLVSIPAQGHVNPLLRLGNLLASTGLLVTFSAPESIGSSMRKANKNIDDLTQVGEGMIRFEFFDDGLGQHDDPRRNDLDTYIRHLELHGKEAVTRFVEKHNKQGQPVACLINNPFIPWVTDIAHDLKIPNAVLWVQSCACLSAYYHYYNKLAIFPDETNPEIDVQLPSMPLLKHDEVPSFLHPHSPYTVLGRAILGQFKNLSKTFCVLIETFEELESELVDYMSKFCLIKPIGPLFKNPKSSNSSIQGDFIKADDCLSFLDSKEPASVVYISFGSVVALSQEQAEEIAFGLLNSGVSFLWVLRPPHPNFDPVILPETFLEKIGERGKIVQWCAQKEVLQHPSVAYFVTHCGWNSTLEAITSGVPVVAFPAWGDQVTNAKYLVEVLHLGVRLSRGDQTEKVAISRDRIENCLKEAFGPKAAELKKNALKWKQVAEEGVAEGGSSDRNLKDFVDKIRDVSKLGGVDVNPLVVNEKSRT
uniref:Glycosyltransferase N-terminal domain-containing protein n=1 Tax=Daucus carota subsp. sativus TaxID=79200 RepID=A0A175YDU5_DAUCS|nr:PREDICTED: putative UDP-glucose glucosyltransferase [Daucus carota subsp. sativus]